MTKKDFRAWRAALHITQAEAGVLLRASRVDVARWESDTLGMPTPSDRIALLCWLARHPAILTKIREYVALQRPSGSA